MSDRTAALARAAAFAALRQSETAASPASHGATPDEAISALEAGLVASGAIEGAPAQPAPEALDDDAKEALILRRYISNAIRDGFALSVHDGGEVTVSYSVDAETVFSAMRSTDSDRLIYSKPVGGGWQTIGSLLFVYGNCPWEVCADGSVSLEPVTAEAEAYAASFEPGAEPAPVEPVAPVQSAPEAVAAPATMYAKAEADGSFTLRQTRFRAALEAGREHPHDVCAVARNAVELRGMCADHWPDADYSALEAPAPVALDANAALQASAVAEQAAYRARPAWGGKSGPWAEDDAPVAMVAQPVQQQQANARQLSEPDHRVRVTVYDSSRGNLWAQTGPTPSDAFASVCEIATGLSSHARAAFNAAWCNCSESEKISATRQHITVTIERMPAMVPLPVQQAQSRDMRASPAPVEPVDGLGAMLARIEAATGPRVVLAAPRAAPEAAPDVVQFDGPGCALGIAACGGLISAAAAYLIAAGLLA